MTREQQKKLRQLKQYLPKIIQDNQKPYKLKKKDYMVWYKKEDVYFSLLIYVTELDGHCYCSSRETIKPMWIDELFWDIMDMPENRLEPLSLRCIGAFSVYGMEAFADKQELSEWSTEELEKCVAEYMHHFSDTIQNNNIADYYSLFDPSAYQADIQKILILIHNCEYEKALESIRSIQGGGHFSNKGIWFFAIHSWRCGVNGKAIY